VSSWWIVTVVDFLDNILLRQEKRASSLPKVSASTQRHIHSFINPRNMKWEGGGALNDNDVCLFVCPSVANRACLRLVWKLPNRSTWKFTTMLGLWKSIAGCSIMTSSQIQDGGRSLRVRKCLCRHISVKNDSIMTTETLIKWFGQNSNIFKFKMADGRHIKTLVLATTQ